MGVTTLIPPETALRTDKLLKMFRDALIRFNQSQSGEDGYKPDKTGLWMKSFEIVDKEIPPILSELESDFKEILGIIENKTES